MGSKFKNMGTELENTRERIEDEHGRKSDALKALSKAQAEIQLWKSRFETEGMGRVDELDASRNKLMSRISEAEETVESLSVKIANGEKSKGRMQSDLEELSMDYERTHAAAVIIEKRGKNFDSQIGELETRLADAEATAMKGGKNAMAKLEMRIRELEMELGSTQSKTSENFKAFQRAERRVKELQFQQEEERKNQDRMSDLANKLQQKIKTYKQQIEEAEEIAALNLAKYRKGQQELEETEERAKLAGVALESLH